SWKLKQVLFNLYLKKNWMSFKTQIKPDKIRKKSYHRFNRRHQFSIRRLNAVTKAWTLISPVKPTIFEINVGAVVQNVGFSRDFEGYTHRLNQRYLKLTSVQLSR